MSWEALNWAGEQRTRAASTQCVLYVLANAADPDGVAFRWWDSPDHWWAYLVQRTRLKRASLFRVLAELEEDGLLQRENGPGKGGPRQPLVRLIGVQRTVDESTTETDETARPPENEPLQSTSETERENDDVNEPTTSLRPSLPHRPASLYNPTNPDPTPKPPSPAEPPKGQQQKGQQEGTKSLSPSQSLPEPIGFNSLIASGPAPELVQRPKVLKAFVALDEASRRRAIERWPVYGAACAAAKKKPRALHLWLAERGFDNIGAAGIAAQAGPRVFVREGSRQWHAWCAFFAVAFGGKLHVPQHYRSIGPRNERGGLLPAEWPPGGELWIVPLASWLVVEKHTPNYNRYAERVHDVFKRPPMFFHPTSADMQRELIAHGNARWGERPIVGLLVPLPWPPRKTEARPDHGEPPTTTGPPLGDLSEQDVDDFIDSS